MGWELRHGGRWYLYRNRRVNGKPVKEYVASRDPFGLGDAMGAVLVEQTEAAAQVRRREREERDRTRARFAALLTATAEANGVLRAVAYGVLEALGFHRHHRGEWRMKRQLQELRDTLANLKERVEKRNPLIEYRAPNNDAEAVELFAKARTGDSGAKAQVAALVRSRGWSNWLGDLGRQATVQLIRTAAGDDPVWEAGITEKVVALRAQVLGDNPTVLEELLARRVINGWLTVHALELELAVRPPTRLQDREHLDRMLTRGQKRFTDAVRELAKVRQLKAPALLAQLNLAANQTVVNGAAPGEVRAPVPGTRSSSQPGLAPAGAIPEPN
ncbi:hypothetical protein GobsT_16120 [Gemmata obscuriglobus]|uniref:Uncharacterized protein n=1 Tax=Gemmata obscuriglobus TaxID=114 RepID=A0A2Z3H8W8_9BACT|nr:hypothetical protein [Gemmata obscuriglobus]AWM39987.1 hypothetical protein C1280_25265 [Gemmata obscuriglobus]QEG26864.1 hypothetical protein GobsT_16120 [Gemmata obscuriglobus]VTS02883.1 Uncharacterized protein OS=Singulisphaera acidiphila (strain ATCC BAA-1392 / DSM 18658 / VKM B-2454 / MOB10) GN=Sinac_7637 PE=4 SV=1 [Gemmata obscuriglobus UQM 2246]